MKRKTAQLLAKAQDAIEADYGVDIVLSEGAVSEIVQRARDFLAVVRHYLGTKGRKSGGA